LNQSHRLFRPWRDSRRRPCLHPPINRWAIIESSLTGLAQSFLKSKLLHRIAPSGQTPRSVQSDTEASAGHRHPRNPPLQNPQILRTTRELTERYIAATFGQPSARDLRVMGLFPFFRPEDSTPASILTDETTRWLRGQVAKATDCKSVIVGSTPTGASFATSCEITSCKRFFR
jgi:hypothetical protein